MYDLTTPVLILLTVLSLAASVLSIRALGHIARRRAASKGALRLIILCSIGSAVTLLYRAYFIHAPGQPPLTAHVDGLLLLATLFGAVVSFLSGPSRLPGINTFAAPLLTLILAWAICASHFTFQLFTLDSPVKPVHQTSSYLGALFIAVAAVAAVMYLYVQKGLKNISRPTDLPPVASLEKIERLLIKCSSLGFALLTLGLITGLLIQLFSDQTRLGSGWWHSPKVMLSGVVWLIFAVVMNVRHATLFRGRRAAWLSIIGLVLLLITFGLVTLLPPVAVSKYFDPTPTSHWQEVP